MIYFKNEEKSDVLFEINFRFELKILFFRALKPFIIKHTKKFTFTWNRQTSSEIYFT